MTKSKYIQGFGGVGSGGGGKGGGGGGRTPTVEDDSLASVQYARIVDLLSEGEIEGIEDDGSGHTNAFHKSIFLDGTPVKNKDGTDNFEGAIIKTENGTQAQQSISGFADAQQEFPVNVEFTKANPVTRTITNSEVDAVRVTLSIPGLYKIEPDGDVRGNGVRVAIQVQYNGGGFSNVRIGDEDSSLIKGKSSGAFKRDYRVQLNGAFPVDIRLVRVSDDETSSKHFSTTIFQSYTEIIEDRFSYPNSAIVGLRLDSRQFSSVPTRKYLIRGIKVGVPINAKVHVSATEMFVVSTGATEAIPGGNGSPGSIEYTGVWNGQLSSDQDAPSSPVWTNDPAWILYDLLTNERYGAGIPESTLDKYDFLAISKYCNETVPDGKGGIEPRFACNILINSRDEVYNVIQQLTAIFRGIAYYGVGTLQLLQDKPSDPQYLLGPSNVVDGIFQYQGTSQKARHTVACVAWQSYDTLGDVEYEYVEDADAIAKYGVIKKDIKAIGCYSQAQAHRIGLWTLKSEQALTETCSFSVAIESGIVLRPGTVVDIADPVKSGVRRSGRIKSATTTQITTDSSVNLSADLTTAGSNPVLSVLLPTGLVEQRPVAIDGITIVGDTAQINLNGAFTPFSEAPAAGSVFLFQNDDVKSQQFRVVSVAEAGDGVYGVSAVAYNASIYNAVDTGADLEPREITILTDPPNPPEAITGQEFLYQEGQTVHTGFDLSWQHDGIALNEFRIKYRIDDDNFTEITTQSPSITLRGLKAGKLQVKIRAVSFIGKSSNVAKSTFGLVGKTEPPGNVQNLSIEPISRNSARLRWDETVDLDVKVGGKVVIKHSNKTDGTATWPNSVKLVKNISGNSTEAVVPLIEGQILVKFLDDLGNRSVNAASILVDQPDTLGRLLVQARREDTDSPPFNGTRTGCFYDTSLTPNALTVDNAEKIDDVTDFDAIVSLDANSGVASSSEYRFENTLDLGAVFALDLSRHFVTRAYFPDETVDGRIGDIDTWSDFNGSESDAVDAQLYMRSTEAAPANSSTYTDADFSGKPWRELINGTFVARAFQFKAELTSSDPGQNIAIEELGYEATFQRRQENSNGVIASGTSTKSITFDKPFFVGTASLGGANAYLPSIGITVQNLGDLERVNVSNVTATGFDLDVLHQNGQNVDRNFSYTAVGYGRRK